MSGTIWKLERQDVVSAFTRPPIETAKMTRSFKTGVKLAVDVKPLQTPAWSRPTRVVPEAVDNTVPLCCPVTVNMTVGRTVKVACRPG
jgi:hypothetical protein